MNQGARFRGCLLGLAAGDAVGTAVEFQPRGTFEPLVDMIGGGPFRLSAGQWTDDTSMALCLAASLIAQRGFDANDQMMRYCRWEEHGYQSSNGACFDIGRTVAVALHRYRRDGNPYSGPTDPNTAGNGSIMRLADAEIRDVQDSLGAIARGIYRHKRETEIRGSGYVVQSLEAALWAFSITDNFADAILAATNLGDDADTTAAVCGQVAGAFYGETGIPSRWLNLLAYRDEIRVLADALGTKRE